MAAADDSALPGPDELSDEEQEAVEAVLFRLADDELVMAERYTEWQVRAPTIESDLAIANIAQDELGHARLWYDLLEDFEYTESDLVFERPADEFRHSTLTELPVEEGAWDDTVVRSYLYDVAERLRLDSLADSSYAKLADRIEKVLGEEDYHREHAESWIRRLASNEEGRVRVQEAVNDLFPYALTLFEPVGDVEEDIDELGLRSRTLEDMREEWYETVSGFLNSVGISVPQVDLDDVESSLPENVGRDGSHTEHWDALHDEMTNTYRELGRNDTARFMEDNADE